ncbi:MAG: M1 family metallopeptidase [Thermoanaerobaculia bacterium]
MKRLISTTSLLALAALLAAPLKLHAGPRVPPVASYRIEAAIDAEHRLTGRETVTFVNRTSFSFEDLQLHLYLNAFLNDQSTWLRESAAGGGRPRKHRDGQAWFGSSELNRVTLADGTDLTPGVRFIAPDDGNADDRTVVSISLPRPVAPGQTLTFTVDFRARFPQIVARTGWKDDFLLGAQWFPKLGVATEKGWNTHQFHASTEFFADFGDYDVTLTLPREMKGKIGATGILKEETELAGDLVRVRFLAEDVHDFAFTACARYEVYRETFTSPGLPNVDLILLLQPDHRRVKARYFRAAREGLAHYGTWYVPYPYATLTIVDPPYGTNAGGMEYPMLITGGASWLSPEEVHSPESVTVHEFGHQIFYGLLASNEFEEGHLDEGFNTYSTSRTLKAAYGDPFLEKRFFGIPIVFRSVRQPYPMARLETFFDWQVASHSDPTSEPTFRNLDGKAIRHNAYSKTALLLASCERTLGEPLWNRILKTYTQRFAFKHPTTADFRAVVTELAGPAADELFKQTWDSTGTIDYAVTSATSRKLAPPVGYVGQGTELRFQGPASGVTTKANPARYESVVVVQRLGDSIWPTEVELKFDGGAVVRRRWDGAGRWIRYRVTGPRLLSAVADPDRKDLLDVDVTNNGLLTEANGTTARGWAFRASFWAQNLLEFFALMGFVA